MVVRPDSHPRSTETLARPAVARRLAGVLERGGLLLVAPAGSGKTTALRETLEARGGTVAWVRCTDAESDPGLLLAAVVDALGAAAPGVADAFGDRLAASTEPVDAAAATRGLVADLARLLVDPLTVVLDDAERLAGSPGAAVIIRELLTAEVPRLRVAVASRRPLPLQLAKLRAAGRVNELGAADLLFSVEECAALLRLRTGREPAEARAEALWRSTEGWALGVALGARGESTPVLRSPDALAAYLEEELLAALGPALREALIDSSVVGELDAAMLEALGLHAGLPDELRRHGVPLSDSRGRTVACHPLVREHLLARLEAERPRERVEELHARAARALEAAGRVPEAVEHWLASGDAAMAAAALARHGQALVRTAPDSVRAWLRELPERRRAAPALRLLEGQLAMGEGRLQEAIAPLREAVAGYGALGDVEAEWNARVVLSDALVIQERYLDAVPLADGFELAEARAAPLVAVTAACALAGAARYRDATDMFARAVAAPGAAPLVPLVDGMRGYFVDLECGRLDDALAGARAAVAHLERDDPVGRLPYLLGMLATIEEERGEDDAALATIGRARAAGERAGAGGYLGEVAARFAAGVHARAGRVAEAESELAAATSAGLGWYAGDAEVTRAAIAVARGRQAAAVEAAERAVEAGALHPWRSRRRSTALLVPVLVAAGRPTRARELLEDALAARPALASCARLLALRAWMRELEGDAAGALEDLARAWAEAGDEPQHLVRRELPRLEPLLWTATERRVLAPEAVVAALEAAVPAGGALLPLTRHPLATMRRAAVQAAATSGHPEAPARVAELERDPDPAVAAAARSARARMHSDPPPLVFTLLGGFAVRRGGYELTDADWGPRRRAAQLLVRFLLVHRDAAVDEDALFEAFWPGRPAAAARRSLQVTVSSARAALEAPGARRSVIERAGRRYRLALGERDVVDAEQYERAARAALASGRIEVLAAAAALWTGEPLPAVRYEEWAVPWRTRLVDLHGRVLAALAETCAAAGDHVGAIDAGRRHVELDPLDELARRRLMLAYARAGRRGKALREYLACRRALVDALGLEPAEETAALQRRILAGEPV